MDIGKKSEKDEGFDFSGRELNQQASNMSRCYSSFNGIIDEIPGISVDNFNDINKRAYLSHCHTDHTEGLYKDHLINFLQRNDQCYIYLSEVTAIIVEHEKCELKNHLKVLPVGEPTSVTLPAVPEENIEQSIVTVTAIPAGHCLGSIMILFETSQKTILYTGDFRILPDDIKKYRDFHKRSDRMEPIKIDAMYVDTTFLNNDHIDFPKRKDSISYLVKEINNWLKNDKWNRIALSLPAKYGYENVFNEIFNKLGKKVYIGNKVWDLYSKMLHLLPGVTNDEEQRSIHVCLNKSPNYDHKRCIPEYNNENYLYIRLSAQMWCNGTVEEVPSELKSTANRLNVCFSTHCSQNELISFINYFSPKKVVGFPNPYIVNKNALCSRENDLVTEFELPKKRRHRRL
ncbi:LOW QUALITY PROTEIN: protein artemis [Aphomia sociella]